MGYAQLDNEGAVFTYKMQERISVESGEKYQSCGGKCRINGEEYFVTAFPRTSKKGDAYLLLRFKPVPNGKGTVL